MVKKTQRDSSPRRPKDERVQRLSLVERKFLKDFGQVLRTEREAQELTLYGIEERGYPSWQHWQKLEDGLRDLKLTTLLRIGKTLKKHPGELLGRVGLKV